MSRGSCLCGAVAWEADAEPGPIAFCHCATCRKSNGAAFATNAAIPRAAFRWVRGEHLLTSYESSPGKVRRFCSRCGSPMSAERPGDPSATVRVRMGTLDTSTHQPRYLGHIWRDEGADWFDPAQEVPVFQQFPPNFG